MVKDIPLQNGMVALVDDEDYEKTIQRYWAVTSHDTTLSITTNIDDGGKNRAVSLQRFIMQLNVRDGNVISFRDSNRLNFQKENLIVSDRKLVARKSRGQRNTSSKYKGVTWDKDLKKWRASIKAEGKRKHLGCFVLEDDAAKAYNKAVLIYFGDDAFQNVIEENNNAREIGIYATNVLPRTRSNKTSAFRGVCLIKRTSKWRADIRHNNKRIYLGSYVKETNAAKAYDQKAYELYGNKAILNFPELKSEYEQALKEV